MKLIVEDKPGFADDCPFAELCGPRGDFHICTLNNNICGCDDSDVHECNSLIDIEKYLKSTGR